MTCYYPLTGWEAVRQNPSGKRSIVFNPRDGFVDRPVELPCGKCSGCRADQSLMWSIRAYHESTLHERNSFLTLTYDDEHLPPDGKIVKKDLQDFFKRFRKHYPPGAIRYIACGEYGDITRRPHYHAIIFGKDWLEEKVTINENLYTAESLSKIWGLGMVSIAPVTMASICYVCGYVTKKINDPDTFNLMSRRPGIGAQFLEKYKEDLLRTSSVTIDGREYPIPKRYLLWDETSFANIKMERRKYAREKTKEDPMDRARAQRSREINIKAKTRKEGEKI